jgi:hypothetical protein
MSLNLGEVCIHALGKSAWCVGVSFSPSIALIGGAAALICIVCYCCNQSAKRAEGDNTSWITKKRVGRKYSRKSGNTH